MRQVCDARVISVQQSCGTADVGNIAYEIGAREGVIVEIVRPSAGDLIADS